MTPGSAADAVVAAPVPAAGVLVIGYGNPLRSDDGVGPAVAARLRADPRLVGADIRALHQLTPDLALDVSRASLLVLVDAADGVPAGAVVVHRLDDPTTPVARTDGSLTHHVGPGSLAGLARELFGAAPPVVIVTVGVASFEVGERLTPAVDAAVPRVARAVVDALVAAAAEGR